MTATRIVLALTLATLAGCDDRIGDYPALLPTDQILAEPAIPRHAAEAASDPTALSDGLRRRADAISVPARGAQSDQLAARADALRERAAELAKTSLDACPEGAAPCAGPQTTPPSD